MLNSWALVVFPKGVSLASQEVGLQHSRLGHDGWQQQEGMPSGFLLLLPGLGQQVFHMPR